MSSTKTSPMQLAQQSVSPKPPKYAFQKCDFTQIPLWLEGGDTSRRDAWALQITFTTLSSIPPPQHSWQSLSFACHRHDTPHSVPAIRVDWLYIAVSPEHNNGGREGQWKIELVLIISWATVPPEDENEQVWLVEMTRSSICVCYKLIWTRLQVSRD